MQTDLSRSLDVSGPPRLCYKMRRLSCVFSEVAMHLIFHEPPEAGSTSYESMQSQMGS